MIGENFRLGARYTPLLPLSRQGLVRSPARAAPVSRRNFWQLPSLRAKMRRVRADRGRASAYGDAAHHAVPVVVAAAQLIGSGRAGGKKDVLALARLHDDLGVFAIEGLRIIDLGRGEEGRGGELVGFRAVVFEVQPVADAVLKGQMIGLESIIDHCDVDPDRLCRGGAAAARHSGQQAVENDIPFHSGFPDSIDHRMAKTSSRTYPRAVSRLIFKLNVRPRPRSRGY